jgi:hypothetical protein
LDQNGKPQVLPVLKEGSDHACIARDELIDTKRGFIPVQDVVVGDLVRTRKGYKRVYCSQFNGTKPTLRITTRNNSLLATHDHRIYTVTQGFTRADALSYTDHLVVRGVSWVNQDQKLQKLLAKLSLRGLFTFNIKEAITSVIVGMDRIQLFCIGMYGSTFTDPFLTDTTSIINIKTMKLQTQMTLNACPLSSTYQNTVKSISKKTKNKLWLILREYARSPNLGTRVLKDGRSIEKLGPWHIKGFSQLKNCVNSVKNHFILKSLGTQTCSVPMPVNQHGVERADGMMKFVSVLSALKNLVLISTAKLNVAHEAVEHVEDGGLREVYDLSVEDVPEFYASNILVHNCDAGRYALSDFIQMRGGIGVWRKLLGRT